ncbi:DinB family protein [Marinomonas mediterranea]|jgi:Uncharacterized protein conserved in bacteria|uniref:DinB family protein n=1 Tax=Marinomonas mediterranea (strain ATCC 700492 / JCM 21426 / NBRC 103028 / MMB-1) TaxID=717774 RepID=F2K4Z7_MARM1|nr:DinB family protein [Marinomonas mediterranea]ADZ92640.1 DinB family protein [Marinomonas mediterranea MMB-1]WCN10580.1 damage-inducible protein DinB [Marinomonas mediterranea]WCN14629.1 damage-inducible protein DinB [Marinomonas mediterranea]WCN18676.1 damage-inducible protein DinB [Marinomonas mediterranea MMB-1]
MSLTSHFELMAVYNQGMNQRLYQVAAQLTPEQLSKARGAFFDSIIGTLNHIVVGDVIWLKRFANHPNHFSSLDSVRSMPSPNALDAVLYDRLSDLEEVRMHLDRIIVEFAAELDDDVLASPLLFNNMKGKPNKKQLGYLVQHFFNHQTHHRGQASTLLYQVGLDVGITDLLIDIPNE